MKFTKKSIRTILLIITFTIALSWAFHGIHLLPATISTVLSFFQPVLLGLALAYVLNIPTRFLENLLFKKPWKKLDGVRQKIGRPLTLFISLVIILGIIIGAFLLVLPTLVETIHQLIVAIPDTAHRAQVWFEKLQENFPRLGEFAQSSGLDVRSIGNKAIVWLSGLGSQLLNSTVSFSVGLAGFLVNFIVALMISFYIILQKEKISYWASSLMYAVMPRRGAAKLSAFLQLSDRCFHNFLTGQIVEAAIFGSLVTLVLSIGGFRYAVLIGVFSGITAIIPVLGAWIGGIIGTILQLTVSPKMALIFLIIFLVIQQVEGNLIYPRVVGKRVGLPAVLVLVGVVLGGSFGGIAGSFISIPLLSIAYELVNLFINQRLKDDPAKQKALEKRARLVTADMKINKRQKRSLANLFFRHKSDRKTEPTDGDKHNEVNVIKIIPTAETKVELLKEEGSGEINPSKSASPKEDTGDVAPPTADKGDSKTDLQPLTGVVDDPGTRPDKPSASKANPDFSKSKRAADKKAKEPKEK